MHLKQQHFKHVPGSVVLALQDKVLFIMPNSSHLFAVSVCV